MIHIPVLLKEVIEYLNPKSRDNFIDCTINGGGHSLAILEKIAPDGKILGIDLDSGAIENLELRIENGEFKKRLILVNDNFVNLENIVKENNFGSVAGILVDLGMSSNQIEESGRGFSFMRDEFLDMRLGPGKNDLTAAEIINRWREADLAGIFYEYGEERFSRRIAEKIIEERRKNKIETTFQLIEIIKKAVPVRFHHSRIHFATRVFQALRIAVNGELDNLKNVLPQMLDILKSGGRGAVISFHSLEDRIAKNFIRDEFKKGDIKILTKKPVVASQEEINENPRARSAKLRVFEKI